MTLLVVGGAVAASTYQTATPIFISLKYDP